MFPVQYVKIEEDALTITDIKTEVCDEFEIEHWGTNNLSNPNNYSLDCQPSIKSEPEDMLLEENLVDYPELVDLPFISKCNLETGDQLPDSIPELKKIIEENKCQMSRYLVEKEYLNYKVNMLTASLNKSNKSSMENEINGLKNYICLLSTNNTKLKNEVKVLKDLVLKKEAKEKRKKVTKKVIYFNNNTLIMRNKDAESEFVNLRKKLRLLRKDNKALSSSLGKTTEDLSDFRTQYFQVANELKDISTKYGEAMVELSKHKEQSASLRVGGESKEAKNDGGEK